MIDRTAGGCWHVLAVLHPRQRRSRCQEVGVGIVWLAVVHECSARQLRRQGGGQLHAVMAKMIRACIGLCIVGKTNSQCHS